MSDFETMKKMLTDRFGELSVNVIERQETVTYKRENGKVVKVSQESRDLAIEFMASPTDLYTTVFVFDDNDNLKSISRIGPNY